MTFHLLTSLEGIWAYLEYKFSLGKVPNCSMSFSVLEIFCSSIYRRIANFSNSSVTSLILYCKMFIFFVRSSNSFRSSAVCKTVISKLMWFYKSFLLTFSTNSSILLPKLSIFLLFCLILSSISFNSAFLLTIWRCCRDISSRVFKRASLRLKNIYSASFQNQTIKIILDLTKQKNES